MTMKKRLKAREMIAGHNDLMIFVRITVGRMEIV